MAPLKIEFLSLWLWDVFMGRFYEIYNYPCHVLSLPI